MRKNSTVGQNVVTSDLQECSSSTEVGPKPGCKELIIIQRSSHEKAVANKLKVKFTDKRKAHLIIEREKLYLKKASQDFLTFPQEKEDLVFQNLPKTYIYKQQNTWQLDFAATEEQQQQKKDSPKSV